MSDLIDPSPVKLIDIEHLLDDSEQDAYNKLLNAGFTKREVKICVRRKPLGQYLSYFEQEHKLLFDDNFRFDTAILQHVHNVRECLKDTSKPADEWVSHGYALAWMTYKSGRPDLDSAIISNEMSRRTKGRKRKRKDMRKKGIEAVLARADVDLWGFGIKAFREYVGQDCKVPALDGHIFISAIEDDYGKITDYAFEYRSSNERESSEDSGTIGAIRTAISRLKKTK